MATPWRLTGAALALCFASAALAQKGDFEAGKAEDYSARQSQAGVTIAVASFQDPDEAEKVFPKAEPHKHGVLPVLVVITNNGEAPIALEDFQVRYTPRGRDGVEPIPSDELIYFNPEGHQPRERPRYIPNVPGLGGPKVKKGPLSRPEITERTFRAPVVAPGDTASGFFFYDLGGEGAPSPGATIYLSGLRNMQTNQELFYFEIPLEGSR